MLNSNLAGKGTVHVAADEGGLTMKGLQVHQLCHGTFHRTVMAAHHASLLQLQPRVVAGIVAYGILRNRYVIVTMEYAKSSKKLVRQKILRTMC